MSGNRGTDLCHSGLGGVLDTHKASHNLSSEAPALPERNVFLLQVDSMNPEGGVKLSILTSTR